MSKVTFEEDELTVVALFHENTRKDTIDILKDTLEALEEAKEDPLEDDLLETIASAISKLQMIEDKYYYSLDLNRYLNNLEDMLMKNDQFAVYRVDRNSEGRDLWHLSYQEAVSRKLAIRIEYYRQIDLRPLLPGESAIALWKRMKESCEVSDVLVLNQNGEIHCYYVNEDYPQLLSGFIRLNPSGTLVTLDTENYRISGKPGNWMATDDIIIDGKQFYLMEHQEYHRQVAYIILDSYGKMIMEECQNGFDEKTKQKLHEIMKVPEQREQEHQTYKDRLEHYQKFYENGTYERSWESGTEGNYNMVDGQVNNLKSAEGKRVERKPAQRSEQSSKKKPKKRESVIKRLREKQIAIAVKSGKPVPRYLEQDMERRRG